MVTIALLVLVAGVSGCRTSVAHEPTLSPKHAPGTSPAAGTRSVSIHPAPTTVTSRRRVAGYSVEHRPIEAITLGHGRITVLIMASIHGDEPAGTPLVHRLRDEIDRHPELLGGRTVVLVPEANPDGMATVTRTNVNGVDLNRNFPAENFRTSRRYGAHAGSEPESAAIAGLIADIRPDLVVSIHQPLRCIDYDGPGLAIAERMAEACELPVRKLGARPGSLGSYVGETLGVPTITVELPGGAENRSSADLWQDYGDMLLVAIASMGP